MKLVLSGLGVLSLSTDIRSELEIRKGYVQTTVLACAICRTDAKMWQQGHRDLVFPRVMGHEMVVRDSDGSKCIIWPGKSCGHCTYCRSGRENLCDDMTITGFHRDGGFGTVAVLPEKSLIPVPESLDTHIACFAEPVGCVINAFEKIPCKAGDSVLIYGAGTMGLITALYAKHLGLHPLLIEKNASKIERIASFLDNTGISCCKETHKSEYDVVINTCADYIAFCQGITKVGKGGCISFFSGISKNEHIETNLLNILHYKEAVVCGAYGLKSADMEKAIPFLLLCTEPLSQLIEEVVSLESVPELMPEVLSGEKLKYIIDLSITEDKNVQETDTEDESDEVRSGAGGYGQLCRRTIESIRRAPDAIRGEATSKIDNKTKPLGALGRLEALSIQMSCIQNSLNPAITSRKMFVFAGDHGITEEGVSAYPSEVTAQMVQNFLNGGAAINVLCRQHDIDMMVVDMGVNYTFKPHSSLIDKKVAKGTRNFALENAMSKEQMFDALENGMQVVFDAIEKEHVDIIGLGEMGIGNTTSATAIISTITGITPADAAGRGTGVDDKGLEHKIEVIEKVLKFHNVDGDNGYEILQKIGGFEIAGITGAVLAAASKQCAVVLDGVISTAAGLIAYLINPDIQGYLISGHKSVEISQQAALAHMGLEPLIDFDMRLGEGTGAALSIAMVDSACRIMSEMASFDEAKVARSNL